MVWMAFFNYRRHLEETKSLLVSLKNALILSKTSVIDLLSAIFRPYRPFLSGTMPRKIEEKCLQFAVFVQPYVTRTKHQIET